MTEQAPPPLQERLENAIRDLGHLRVAAVRCHVNFEWLSLGRGQKLIPLLDFDIIFGTMGNLVTRTIADEVARGLKTDTEPSLPELPVGPNTLRYLLENLHEYALPPGTTAEMFARRKKLTGTISDRADEFMRK